MNINLKIDFVKIIDRRKFSAKGYIINGFQEE